VLIWTYSVEILDILLLIPAQQLLISGIVSVIVSVIISIIEISLHIQDRFLLRAMIDIGRPPAQTNGIILTHQW